MTDKVKKHPVMNRIAGAADREDSRQALQRAGRVIELLEEQVENSRGVFNQKVVDEDVFFTLMTRLRSSLPIVLENAETLALRVEQIQNEAQTIVDQLTADSQSESEHIARDAKTQAQEMLPSAEIQSERMVADARKKAEGWLLEATQRSESMVARHPLNQDADHRRQHVHAQALQEAHEVCEAGDRFASEVLERAEFVLIRLQECVTEGKNQLKP